jgi:hypothetical protein
LMNSTRWRLSTRRISRKSARATNHPNLGHRIDPVSLVTWRATSTNAFRNSIYATCPSEGSSYN